MITLKKSTDNQVNQLIKCLFLLVFTFKLVNATLTPDDIVTSKQKVIVIVLLAIFLITTN